MANLNHTIFDFSENSNISSWSVIGDVVMGGVSEGNFIINENANGLYFGKVSLENNGGFSLLKYRFDVKNVLKYKKAVLKVKGDGKQYQFRIKDSCKNSHSYVKYFQTSEDWQLIEINLAEMYPTYRGRKLDIGYFSSTVIEEIAILIGNKKEENFSLEIDKIYLE